VIRTVEKVCIITIQLIVHPGRAEEQFVVHQRGSQAESVALKTVISHIGAYVAFRGVSGRLGNDIDHPSHGVPAIERSLRAAQYFNPFDIQQLGNVGIQTELAYTVYVSY